MKNKILLALILIIIATIAVCGITAMAAEGIYYYSVSNGEAKIIDCDNSATGEIIIPATLGGYPVTSIGSRAFENCTGLTSITIPGSVTSIGNDAFYWCTRLTSITIPDSVTSIGSSAFYNCARLTSVTIGNGVTSIRDYAFYNCDGLTSVTIGNGVTSIGDCAFYNCDGLASVTIGNGVTSIGDSAFYNCTGLTKVNITDIAAWCNIEFDSHDANPLYCAKKLYLNGKLITNLTIPDSVTSIGSSAFYNCTGLTSITIPDSVTSIGSSAFYNCTGLTKVNITDIAAWCNIVFYSYDAHPLCYAENLYLNGELVTELTIPQGVTSIGDRAFYSCDSLTNVTIPDSVTSIGNYAFAYCDGLISVTIPDSVTSIGNYAFAYCDGLISVTIPDSVTSIGDDAFYSCDGLTKVNITDIAAWCNIDFGDSGANPLYYAKKLYLNGKLITNLTIPDSVTSIGSSAFSGCTGLRSITIPDSVTSIGDYAFYSCDGLRSITIPDSVTSIGSSAFYNCRGLTSITIPDSVTSIGSSAFYNCKSLTGVTIGKGIELISENTFYNCNNIKYVCLSDAVSAIRNDAFNGCNNIETVYYEGSESEWNEVLFYPRNEKLTNANIIYNAVRKTYKFETNCENTLDDVTDYAVFTTPMPENEGKTFWGWYDNKECTGSAITFPYYGTATTLYARWTDKGGTSFDDAFIIEQNSRYTVTTTSWDEMVYFEFTPNQTRLYNFYTTTSSNIYAYLYNENKSRITYSYGGNISYKLTAGKTYYIAIKPYYSGTYTLVTETPLPAEYKVNSLTVKNSSGNTVYNIPNGKFTATVSFTCLNEGEEKTVIILAKYDENGAYNGLLYVGTKDVTEGSTLELTLPVDNSDGSIKTLKAFMRPVGDLLTPVGNSVSFPAK